MNTYETIDGTLKLESIGDGLLFNPETHESYEKRLCRKVRERKLRFPTLTFEVAYWTNADDRYGTCAPSGLKEVTFYRLDCVRECAKRIENRKQFKRIDGTSRIYDIVCTTPMKWGGY